MTQHSINIIMPVKDSIETTERALRVISETYVMPTVYNDFSTAENTKRLVVLSEELGFRLIHLSELTDHPSPNYRTVLINAQQQSVAQDAHLIIVESDVIVCPDTINRLIAAADADPQAGLIAAVTTDESGNVNFPYLYAKHYPKGSVNTSKRLSFCCTLLSIKFLKAFPFTNLDQGKDWFDVPISHASRDLGFHNLLLTDTPVLHLPHSSRPWKQLKYTNPILYYWRKLTRHTDKI